MKNVVLRKITNGFIVEHDGQAFEDDDVEYYCANIGSVDKYVKEYFEREEE